MLVTGASSGFGKMFVEAFLGEGWTVYATLRGGAPRMEEIYRASLLAHPEWRDRCVALDLHVDREASVNAVVEKVNAAGGLDLLIHNAGYGLMGPLEDMSIAELRHQMESNFLGAVALTQGLLPALRAHRGRVIVMSSVAGRVGIPFYAAYNASKFALEGFFDALAYELRPEGVSVCLVEPGGFCTSEEPRDPIVGERFWTSSRNREANGQFARQLKLQGTMGANPARVVRLVLRLAQSRRVPIRALIGWDAWGLMFLTRFIPAWLHRRLFEWGFRRVMFR